MPVKKKSNDPDSSNSVGSGSDVGSGNGSGSQAGSRVGAKPSPKPTPKPTPKSNSPRSLGDGAPAAKSRSVTPSPKPTPKTQSKAAAVKKTEVDQSSCEAMGVLGKSENDNFSKFRSLFNCQFSDGIPMLMMFQALDDESIKHCGMHDERCEVVLHSYIKSLGSGIKRTVADEETLFSRFVSTLNEGRGTAKDFAGKGFDVKFFKDLHGLCKKIVDGAKIEGLEISESGYRVNISGEASSRSKFDDESTFLQKLLGSGKYLTEANLLSHLSTTHALTKPAQDMIDTINVTNTSRQIKQLITKTRVVPEILQGALVFRALGDNGKLIRVDDGPAGEYHVAKTTPLGRVLLALPSDAKAKFVSDESGSAVVIPFGKVSSLTTTLFTPVKENDKPVRTIIDRDQALEYTALAVVFRHESALKSMVRSKEKKAL